MMSTQLDQQNVDNCSFAKSYHRAWRSNTTISSPKSRDKPGTVKRSGTSGNILKLYDQNKNVKLDTLRRRMEYSQKVDLKNRVMLKSQKPLPQKPHIIFNNCQCSELPVQEPELTLDSLSIRQSGDKASSNHAETDCCKLLIGTKMTGDSTAICFSNTDGLPPRLPRRRAHSSLRSAYPKPDIGFQSRTYVRRTKAIALRSSTRLPIVAIDGQSGRSTPTRLPETMATDKLTIDGKIRHLIELHQENYKILERRFKSCPKNSVIT
ncbi:hypothetical protein ACOME3_010771 [Neoechinorhynchus agilis]